MPTRRARAIHAARPLCSPVRSHLQTAVQQLSREGRIAKDGSILSEAEAKEFAAASEDLNRHRAASAPSLKQLK
jgi:hypothetical protein